jgi:succinate dehydrogenase flavin-adding protein (antitoxin of CptAB toxin-antitoxin module)
MLSEKEISFRCSQLGIKELSHVLTSFWNSQASSLSYREKQDFLNFLKSSDHMSLKETIFKEFLEKECQDCSLLKKIRFFLFKQFK